MKWRLVRYALHGGQGSMAELYGGEGGAIRYWIGHTEGTGMGGRLQIKWRIVREM